MERKPVNETQDGIGGVLANDESIKSQFSDWLDSHDSSPKTSRQSESEFRPFESLSLNELLDVHECLALLEQVWPTMESEPDEESVVEAGSLLADRYEVVEEIGKGGFGIVFRAVDTQLKRDVAIKVGKRNSAASSVAGSRLDLALKEAQVVAGLRHPNIVSVFDIGRLDSGTVFVVSELIEGDNLAELIKQGETLPTTSVVTVIAKIADALAYAHDLDIIHRDIKPANILIDQDGEPHLADFGLATTVGQMAGGAGTSAYMSPEQINRREHRIGERCDIYGLGVTLYEGLTGNRPFDSRDLSELAARISSSDYRPMSVVQAGIPLELQRIQEIAMASKPSARYSTAAEFASDLRHFLHTHEESREDVLNQVEEVAIVPCGLRSYSQTDSQFFLQLLPGVRDRDGLPDSIRFWKIRIEQDHPFEVGVIFGPSGCGKSSFVKAGLLPTLSADIFPIYVEASPNDTAQEILEKLRDEVSLPANVDSLAKAFAFLCSTKKPTEDAVEQKRFLIVIDQFEQWLQANTQNPDEKLLAALGNCNGESVTALLLIRDDYWMELNRLMATLDIPLSEGSNTAALDLFQPPHAVKVLRMLGQATGDLPTTSELSEDHHDFLRRVVSELDVDGRVICVHLALFTQMMKGKEWSSATLDQLGEFSKLGVQYFEQLFESQPFRAELHRQGAISILTELLPTENERIKGSKRTFQQLRAATKLDEREFKQLVELLDKELRLISPVADRNQSDDAMGLISEPEIAYQLSHDFLVPSLNEWLNRDQRKTRVGRAEICLADRTAIWQSEKKVRHLPSLTETLEIQRFANREKWSMNQSEMMRSAKRHYLTRAATYLFAAGLLLAVVLFGRYRLNADRFEQAAKSKVDNLLIANSSDLPRLIAEAKDYEPSASTHLSLAFQNQTDPRGKLHAGIALLGVSDDEEVVEYVSNQLLQSDPTYTQMIRNRLPIGDQRLNGFLWGELKNGGDGSHVLPTASTLVVSDPNDGRWEDVADLVVESLVRGNPLDVGEWMALLQPKAELLKPSLTEFFLTRRAEFTPSELALLTRMINEFANDDVELIFNLVVQSEYEHFLLLFESLKSRQPRIGELVRKELAVFSDRPGKDEQSRIRLKNTILLALKLDMHDEVWPFWDRTVDPTIRTELIHSLKQFRVPMGPLIQKLKVESNPTIRYSVLLGLGEAISALDDSQRSELAALVLDWFEDDVDSGVHGACRWLIENSFKDEDLKEKAKTIEQRLSTGVRESERNWYVTKTGGMVLTVIDGPVEFTMGSTFETAPDRDMDERRRQRSINRDFAIGQLEVTVEQFSQFWNERPKLQKFYGYADDFFSEANFELASGRINWFMAAEFCNWLSEKEGIPQEEWCFPLVIDRVNGIEVDESYFEKTGYRLLSEAEWEMACRDGALSTWHFGNDRNRLGEFAWWIENSDGHVHGAGLLKPNSLGLFDVYGNVLEWVFDGLEVNIDTKEDVFRHPMVNPTDTRILRGGFFDYGSVHCRSAYREGFTADAAGVGVGFRVGRTLRVHKD